MDKQKKEQFILLALILFLLIMLPKVLLKKKIQEEPMGNAPTANSEEQVQSDVKSDNLPVLLKSPSLEAIEKLDVNMKDPFDMPQELHAKIKTAEVVSKEGAAEELSKIDLRGITWGGKMPMAFIDDKVYKIGDTVSDAKIVDINSKGVYFLYNDKKILIKLKK